MLHHISRALGLSRAASALAGLLRRHPRILNVVEWALGLSLGACAVMMFCGIVHRLIMAASAMMIIGLVAIAATKSA